jgi:hypothetical protein
VQYGAASALQLLIHLLQKSLVLATHA